VNQTPPTSDPIADFKDVGLPGPTGVLVKGLAVKVPSNRYYVEDCDAIARDGYHPGINASYRYFGDWDGTFKLERGCSNPAYILADLLEREGETSPSHSIGGDWVTNDRTRPWLPNWQMLYDWGVHCDQPQKGSRICDPASPDIQWISPAAALMGYGNTSGPRMTVNTIVSTPEEMSRLRETLRMHCLRWQSTDPRYRTSYPVISYTS
jgi:hypothetical protein